MTSPTDDAQANAATLEADLNEALSQHRRGDLAHAKKHYQAVLIFIRLKDKFLRRVLRKLDNRYTTSPLGFGGTTKQVWHPSLKFLATTSQTLPSPEGLHDKKSAREAR